MRRLVCILGLALLPGCAMVLTEATRPEVREVVSTQTPTEMYARAHRTAATMGAVVQRDDPATHTFVATYKDALALHVHVASVPTGTQMTVTGSIRPQHVAYGLLTEVDDFVLAYHRTP